MYVVVDDGITRFEGTLEQFQEFQDCSFSDAPVPAIESWAKKNGYTVQIFNSRFHYQEYCDKSLAEIIVESKINRGEEPTITTSDQLEVVLKQISFINTVLDFKWEFHYESVSIISGVGCLRDLPKRNGWLVWVSFDRPDTDTGKTGRGRGRDEIIWEGTTLSGVIKTCWLLVELMIRHELMEGYRWKDARIFNPHNSVLDLAKIQELHAQRQKGK